MVEALVGHRRPEAASWLSRWHSGATVGLGEDEALPLEERSRHLRSPGLLMLPLTMRARCRADACDNGGPAILPRAEAA